MPPPLLDGMQIANALRNEALPALERPAGRPRDSALARFERDEPPPYVSSTEDEDEDEYAARLAPASVDGTVLDELHRHLDEPLDDDQRHRAGWQLKRTYCPGTRYDEELKLETGRVESWVRVKASDRTREYFLQYGPARKGRAGRERVNIIARRNIRRRWQKLGVWNPEWGIPGRANGPKPNDDTCTWEWRWQSGDAAAEWRDGLNPQHPITRALRLRQGLFRSEHSPVLPRSHLEADTSVSQAESFVTSRPWFMFALEISENHQRYSRLPFKAKQIWRSSKSITELWKERGDWKTEWRTRSGETLIGWKWRHESPSPEPEDLSTLEDLATLELTPSEADALEAVPPPSPDTPRPTYVPPASSRRGSGLFGLDRPHAASPPLPQEEALPQEEEALPQEEVVEQPPRKRRPRRQQPTSQALRRSKRIADIAAHHATPPSPVSRPGAHNMRAEPTNRALGKSAPETRRRKRVHNNDEATEAVDTAPQMKRTQRQK